MRPAETTCWENVEIIVFPFYQQKKTKTKLLTFSRLNKFVCHFGYKSSNRLLIKMNMSNKCYYWVQNLLVM